MRDLNVYHAIIYEKPLCPICGKRMVWFVDTLLCPVCNNEQLYILKYDDMKRKENVK